MKVIIVDDDSLVTLSLKTILEANNDINVVAIGHDGKEALDLYKKHAPDILLMDIQMKESNGIDAASEIIAYDNNAKILLLTTFLDDKYIIEALKVGVKGYLLKQDYHSIIPAINSVMNNQSVFVNAIVDKIPNLVKNKNINIDEYKLSSKEMEVIECIASGLNNKEISLKLFLSEGTIRNYISSILAKLDLRDRTQIAIFYYTKIEN